jgi:hypothetical protein
VINQGLSVLLRLAESEDPSTRAMCADTLCELSRSRKGCPRVVKDGGIQILIGLLARDANNKLLQCKVAEALSNLMKIEWTSPTVLVSAVPSVVELLLSTRVSATRTAATKIMYNLSMNLPMRAPMAACGAIEALLPLARTGATDTAVQMRCVAAVCNIARGDGRGSADDDRAAAERLARAGAIEIFLGCVRQAVGDASSGKTMIPGRTVVDSVAALSRLAEDDTCAENIVRMGLESLIKLATEGTVAAKHAHERSEAARIAAENAAKSAKNSKNKEGSGGGGSPRKKDGAGKKSRGKSTKDNKSGGGADDGGAEDDSAANGAMTLAERRMAAKQDADAGMWSSKAREWCSVILCRLSENVSTRKKQVLTGVCPAMISLALHLHVTGDQSAREGVAQRCAAAFNNYSLDDASINRLAEDGVIEVLLKLATSYSEQCRENCARALCNICAGFGMEHVVVNGTTAVPELMVMALVRSESIVTKQICAVALMNVLVDETMNKMIKYGIVWAMSSLTQSSQSAAHAVVKNTKSLARGSPRSPATVAAVTPEVHALLVTACATAFMNISCSKSGRAHILADPGALQAVFHFLLGGASGNSDPAHHGVDHCQQLAWDIIWNLIEDDQNHHTLVQNDLLRTVETLAVTARSDVDFDMGSGAHGSRAGHGSLDMDDHVLREIFNLIDTDGSNTLDKYELLDAIANNQQVLELVHSAPILEPLLQPDAFENALMELDTAHQSIVTYSEFKAFLISQTRRVTRAQESVDINKSRAKAERGAQKSRRVSSHQQHHQIAAAASEEEDNYSEDNYSDEDQDGFEDEDQDDGSPTVSSLLAVMNEQARITNSGGGKEEAAKRTALTLRNVAIALRRLSSNPSICDEIVARSGISIIVAASRSVEVRLGCLAWFSFSPPSLSLLVFSLVSLSRLSLSSLSSLVLHQSISISIPPFLPSPLPPSLPSPPPSSLAPLSPSIHPSVFNALTDSNVSTPAPTLRPTPRPEPFFSSSTPRSCAGVSSAPWQSTRRRASRSSLRGPWRPSS